ncbi:DJ-1/PfpI family protein [Bacillus ndiopicus]|uniref:DJ-1/PfpI family protein n=1 Tax=Bacillus ndiopicus TaxID=1347368 RepID=UPI0005AA2BBC|nr:DJ-1/PfpI family protein [Bacillus ndiopicus]
MTKKTAILLYPYFSEYELTTALSILMQGGKPVSFIGLTKDPIIGESGLTCLPDLTIDDIQPEEYDSLLLSGCMYIDKIIDIQDYSSFIQRISSQKNFVTAAISSSPYLLAKAGLLKGKKYTVGLSEELRKQSPYFEEENYVGELVVTDNNLITAWGAAFISFGVQFGKALQLDFEEGWYRG